MDYYVVYYKALLENQPLLIIPVADAAKFCTKPLKWIRYITSAVLGAKGDLKKYDEHEDASNSALDLEDVTPAQRKFLFIPGEPVKFVDCLGLDHLGSSQFTTESRAEFRDALVARDGTSVISGALMLSEAIHLIPHSKGTEYIQAVCRWRMDTEVAEITDIDDTRNGILIDKIAHDVFAEVLLAFLPTPNFALAVDEVLPQSTHINPPLRFTPHYFLDDSYSEVDKSIVDDYQRDLRYPIDMVNGWPADWPPRFLLDFIYGVVIARKYGNNDAMNALGDSMESNYYPQGIETATNRALAQLQRDKLKEAERKRGEQKVKGENGSAEMGMDSSDAFDLVFSLWTQCHFGLDGQEARAKEMEEHARRELQRRRFTAEKVEMWRQKVDSRKVRVPGK